MDGSPATNLGIRIHGRGLIEEDPSYAGHFSAETITNSDGLFDVKLAPYLAYQVTLQSDEWGFEESTLFAFLPDKPIGALNFKVRPATRIHGRLTVGSENQPIANAWVTVMQLGQIEVPIPNSEGSFQAQPQFMRGEKSDEQGYYQLFVGFGEFRIKGTNQTDDVVVSIGDETEKEINFHASRPDKGRLTGRVFVRDSNDTVPNARIDVDYSGGKGGSWAQDSVATDKGTFEFERELQPMYLYATNSDRSLAGIVELGPDNTSVEIPIQPTATAIGRLINQDSGQALMKSELQYSVRVYDGPHARSSFMMKFGGNVFTDENGRFEMPGLVIGQKYFVDLVTRGNQKPGDITWRTITEVIPDRAGELDLGDLKYSEPKPYVPPTLDEQIATHFGVKGTPIERLDAGCKRAKLSQQLVLVQFADPAAQATRDFIDIRLNDSEVARALDGYRTMAVSIAGDFHDPAKSLAEKLGIALPIDESQSLICVVDTNGAVVANLRSEDFLVDGKVNRERILDFLAEHSIKPFDAQELLNETLKRAKDENKRVFIQETATWCGPCWTLSQYLDKTRAVWEKDYIWLKMDHRWTGANELMQKIRNGAEGGIPWIAILDSDGKLLATSNDESGENVGFPTSQLAKSHFRKMINDTRIRLTEVEVDQFISASDKRP